MATYALAVRICVWLVLVISFGQGRLVGAPPPLRVGGTGWALQLAANLAAAYRREAPGERIVIAPSLGSTGGIRALQAGALDIALSSRLLLPEERPGEFTELLAARTPLALVTSHARGDRELTVRDVAEVYGLRRLKWADGTPIRIVLRPRSETDTDVLERSSPEVKVALAFARSQSILPIAQTDADNLRLLSSTAGSFGFTALTAVLLDPPDLHVLPLNDTAPTLANLASGAYPLAKPLYLIVSTRTDARVVSFLKFVRGPAGRRVLEQAGCLPPLPAPPAPKGARP